MTTGNNSNNRLTVPLTLGMAEEQILPKKYSIGKVIWAELSGYFLGRAGFKNIPFPEVVGQYRFRQEIFQEKEPKKFAFALYEDDQGCEAMAKQVSAKPKDFNYYALRNEINVYRLIQSLYETKGQELRKRFPNITIPKFLVFIEDEERLFLLIEKVEGAKLTQFDLPRRIKIYEDLIAYFQFLGEQVEMSQPTLARITMLNKVLIFPLLFLKTPLRYPWILWPACRAAAVFTKSIPKLLKRHEMTFVHRSLEPHNVIIKGGQIYVIDFELSVFTDPLLELTQLIIFSWQDPGFFQAFYQTPRMQKIFRHSELFGVYRALLINAAIHQLAAGKTSNYQHYRFFLNHAMNLKAN